MNSNFTIFRDASPIRSGIAWVLLCSILIAAVAAARAADVLTQVCVAIIVAYSVLAGFLPYVRNMLALESDMQGCVAEYDDLRASPSDQVELLLAQDDSDAASVHKLARVLASSKRRSTKESAEASFLESFDAHWDPVVERLNDVAAYCPTLGIAGTMLGLADLAVVFEKNGGNAGIGAAIATMSLTTLTGGICFVLISGLARRAAIAVAKHRSYLKYVAAMFQRGEEADIRSARPKNDFKFPGDQS